MNLSKKALAAMAATVLTAVAGVLTQCPDDAAAPVAPVEVDAGAPE